MNRPEKSGLPSAVRRRRRQIRFAAGRAGNARSLERRPLRQEGSSYRRDCKSESDWEFHQIPPPFRVSGSPKSAIVQSYSILRGDASACLQTVQTASHVDQESPVWRDVVCWAVSPTRSRRVCRMPSIPPAAGVLPEGRRFALRTSPATNSDLFNVLECSNARLDSNRVLQLALPRPGDGRRNALEPTRARNLTMSRSALALKSALLIVTATTAVVGYASNAPLGADAAFVAASFHSNNLVIYPFRGSPIEIEPPNGLNVNFILLGSSTDGEAVYGQSSYPNRWAGIIKIEFNRARISIVPGSAGLGDVASLIESPQSGKIFVSARRPKDGGFECGVFEIDPRAGSLRPLRIGTYPDCGGPISPDGRREMNVARDVLSLRDLVTGSVEDLGKGFRTGAWSPDGRWIAAVTGDRGSSHGLLLIDANNTSRRRKLGSGDSQPVWSPDSRWLLTMKVAARVCLDALRR